MRKHSRDKWFSVYKTKDYIDVLLAHYPNAPFGWEWSYRDGLRGEERPLIDMRIGKLWILYFEPLKTGFELHFMGFWWIR